jgi:hypothetical protein
MENDKDHVPDLVFLRSTPGGWLARPPLPAALQTFETSLIAVALGRYHTGLVLTVSAIEATLKAYLNIPLPTPDDYGKDWKFDDLIKEAKTQGLRLGEFKKANLDFLRNKRNRMAHFGHAPTDNPACAGLLLDIAYPLFGAILFEGFAYDLAKAGLLPDPGMHWAKAFELRAKTKGLPIDAADCFTGLSHFLRRNLSPTFLTKREQAMSAKACDNGRDFDFLQNRLRTLESKYTNYWLTDCPNCGEVQCLALDLLFQDKGLDVGVRRAMCVHCDWVVPENGPLATIVFADQIAEGLPEIVKGFGLEK